MHMTRAGYLADFYVYPFVAAALGMSAIAPAPHRAASPRDWPSVTWLMSRCTMQRIISIRIAATRARCRHVASSPTRRIPSSGWSISVAPKCATGLATASKWATTKAAVTKAAAEAGAELANQRLACGRPRDSPRILEFRDGRRSATDPGPTGRLTADTAGLGYTGAAAVFGALLALAVAAYF